MSSGGTGPPQSPQTASVSGNYNIVVQASGDGITIDIARPHLTLLARHRLVRTPTKYLDLLNPFNRAIPMVGRDSELRDLAAWLDSEATISARCLIGGAGSGKTRLALELCAAAEDKRGWFAGFVDHRELTRFRAQQNLSAWGWPKPTLIVVDYAAAKARVLREWLAELVQHQGRAAKPLRLLLLERHAEPNLGWWPELTTPGEWAEEDLRELFDPAEPIPLRNIGDVEHRRQMLAAVMAAASSIKSLKPALQPPAQGENLEFDRRLADPAKFAPLYLLMAGALGVKHGVQTLLVLGPTDMAERLADSELARIDTFARDRKLSGEFLRYLAAGVTLIGGLSIDDLGPAIAEEGQALGCKDASLEVEGALRDALPDEQPDRIAPILPDLIGEAAVIKAIRGLTPKRQTYWIKRWHLRAPGPAMSGIIRTIQDYAEKGDHPALGWFDAIVASTRDLGTLTSIADQMPKQTVALRERAARVHARIVETFRTVRNAQDDQSFKAVLAVSLINLAKWLSELGRREEALARAQEAAELYRTLAASANAFRPNLTASLNNLAVMMSALGRREEALTRAQEAAELYRELAAERPDAFRSDLARSLNNLAATLSDLGRREEALARAEEAVDLYRELTAERLDAFRPDLAVSLNNLANALSELGRREDALARAQEAVDLHRELATERPDAFRPDLAASLNNLANRLRDLGQREEALARAREAVDIRRELAALRPDAFRPDLAASLNNLANMLSAVGQREEALARAQEAVELYRELAAKRPDVFRPDLASSLNNLANMLSAVGRREEALALAQETVDIRRELAAERPDAFRPNLATSLSVVALCLEAVERIEEANQAGEEALAMLSEYFIAQPPAFAGLMGAMVGDYARRCEKLGHKPDMTLLGPILEVLKKLQDADS